MGGTKLAWLFGLGRVTILCTKTIANTAIVIKTIGDAEPQKPLDSCGSNGMPCVVGMKDAGMSLSWPLPLLDGGAV